MKTKLLKAARGFSMIELAITLGVIGVTAAIAIPATTGALGDMRLRNDARALHNTVALAKMRAGTRFSWERVFVDLSSETFVLQWKDKTSATCCWSNEDSAVGLSSGIDFGWGSLTTPPPNTQDSLAQSVPCLDDDGEAIANTACVVFNSRGIPINPSTGSPTGNTAFYLTDGVSVYATTLTATPLIRIWWSPAHASDAWVKR